MASPPSFEDLFQAARREALARPTRLTLEIIDTDGSDVNIALAVGAAQAEEIAAYATGEINATRLRTVASVSEAALEQYGASELGGETRRGALAAVVPLIFRRDPGGGSLTIPAGTLAATEGGVTFQTLADLVFQGGGVGPDTVTAQATTAGSGGNVLADTILRVVSPLSDLTVTVSNSENADGGEEEESVDDYQARLQTAFQRAAKGTLAAIQAAAEATEGIVSARAFELLDGDCQTGRVVLQILGPGGSTNASLASRVLEVMEDTRAAGVPVVVQALNPVSVPIAAAGLVVETGLDIDAVLGEASLALVALVGDLQVGAVLRVASILGTLEDVEGLQVPDGSLTAPVTDVVPGEGEYLTTELDLVTLATA